MLKHGKITQIKAGGNMLKKILHRIDEQFSLYMIAKIIGVLLIVLLLIATEEIWGSWVSMLTTILRPFILGFAIAYIMHPLISFLEKKGISKNITIIVLWILVIVGIVVLLFMLMPTLYAKINEFLSSLITGVQWISSKIKEVANLNDFSLVNSMTENIVNLIEKYDDWMPGLVSTLPSLMSSILDVITNVLFTIIIAIYMLFDYDRIKVGIKKFMRFFVSHCDPYLHEIDENVTVYLKSMVLLIFIRFFEYCAFYYFIGHHDWLIIGILSAILAVIPYIGGTVANAIGIITGLTLAPINLMILIVGILVLSNVDNYIISPMVHEKRSSLGPLITLLAVFAGGVVYNLIGIMISIPFVIACKTTCDLYKERHADKYETKSE